MYTDSYIPPHFKSVIGCDEELLWIGTPTFIPFILRGIPFLILGILWGIFDFFFIGIAGNLASEMMGFIIPFMLLHSAPFWLSILNMLRLILVYKNTNYGFTNKKIMFRTGFFGVDFRSIDYDKVSNIEVNVNPIENLFNVGSIILSSGRVNSKGQPIPDRFISITNPYEVYRKMNKVITDVKTDIYYPNKLRPDVNPGYNTQYIPKSDDSNNKET